jgi:parallel beta-helix repeat protein
VTKLLSFCVALLPMVLTAACNSGTSGACADGKYPAAPAGASDVVYVSAACPADGADGTADHPYPTIGDAASKAKAGATVLVAAGTYKEQLAITRDLTILGEVTKGAMGADGAIILQSPEPYAVTVGPGATATIQGFRIEDAQGIGVWASGGSVTVDGCSIAGTTLYTAPKSTVASGFGVLASEDGAIILQDSAVTGSALGGVLLTGAPMMGATVNGASGSIVSSDVSHNKGYGVRVDQASGMVTIQDSTLSANVGFGIGVFSSGAIILQNHIEDTALDASGIGDGLITGANVVGGVPVPIPSSIRATGNTITGSGRVGALCAAGAGGIILQDNTISGSAAAAPFGAGVWLQQGAGAMAGNKIVGNTLSANRFVGLGLTGDTGGIILQNNTVTGTTLGSTFVGLGQVSIGDGISVLDGASAQITGNTVSQNGRFGLILDGEGSATSIQNNVIEDNDKYGIILQNQPAMPPATSSNTYSGNKVGNTDTVAPGTYGIDASDFATQ